MLLFGLAEGLIGNTCSSDFKSYTAILLAGQLCLVPASVQKCHSCVTFPHELVCFKVLLLMGVQQIHKSAESFFFF